MKNALEKKQEKSDKQELTEIYEQLDACETPEFSIKMRGYDRVDVDRYLGKLVVAYNEMFENYQKLENELNEYKKKENIISTVLIEAQAVANEIIENAKTQASQISKNSILESNMNQTKNSDKTLTATNTYAQTNAIKKTQPVKITTNQKRSKPSQTEENIDQFLRNIQFSKGGR